MRTYLLPFLLLSLLLTACSDWKLASKVWTDPSAGNVPELVLVNGGTFQMGKDDGKPVEKPAHTVTVKSFYIGKYEVTVKQYKAFCTATKKLLPENPYWYYQDNNPMVFVTQDDAKAYCSWLSEQTGKSFRLPTESEWEYAAKGATSSQNFTYAGSNNADEVAWYGMDNFNYRFGDDVTHPVGQKKPNQLGLYDMSGNVWEWCSDWFAQYPTVAVTNYSGPPSGSYRVFRGASWADSLEKVRTTFRFWNYATIKQFNIGFRVAQDVK